ncbi:MAG: Rep protein [CRESS virus sp. ctrF513]|nr:MAG: Rep protein [CRESS virus sp. ctrF513]
MDNSSGNTKPRNIKKLHWLLTINNPKENELEELAKIYKITGQYEKGENGTRHIQCVVSFNCQRYFNSIKEMFPRAHIEPVRRINDAVNYVTKIDTRDCVSPVIHPDHKRYIKREIKNKFLMCKPYKWQEEIMTILDKEPDDRTIYWYWDPIGCTGKSVFTKHLVMTRGAFAVGGRVQDALYMIMKKQKKGLEPDIIIFDIPRNQGNDVSYNAIESIKNGCCFSSKYKSKDLIFNTPHIIIFANSEPNLMNLSSDRWCVRKIELTYLPNLVQDINDKYNL